MADTDDGAPGDVSWGAEPPRPPALSVCPSNYSTVYVHPLLVQDCSQAHLILACQRAVCTISLEWHHNSLIYTSIINVRYSLVVVI